MEKDPLNAHQACSACKKNKRKCDKRLPACGLCARTGRACEYDETPRPPPSADEFAALQVRITELEARLNIACGDSASVASPTPTFSSPKTWTDTTPSLTQFPFAMFLDLDCYEWARMKLPRPTATVPMDVLTILNQANGILEISQTYFNTIHRWMPIISRKRIDLGIPFQGGGPDLAVLFLAMKLVTTHPESTESLYETTRAFLRTLEADNVISIRCLQAIILVALYEYSHALYPAAWMTVGACSRYADIIGLSPSGRCLKIIESNTTWTELEERRRTWWAIFILDRAISLGSRRRFSCPEPTEVDVLPGSDVGWNSGNVSGALNCAVSTPFSNLQSPFARLCQSAICIDRVMKFRHTSQQVPKEQSTTMATVLTKELCAFSDILEGNSSRSTNIEGYQDLFAPRCLVWSALFLLLDNYCCPEKLANEPGYPLSGIAKTPEEQILQVDATIIVRSISDEAHNAILKVVETLDDYPRAQGQLTGICPFALDALYCTMATFHWQLRESGDETARVSLEDIAQCLQRLGEVWPLALRYLALEGVYSGAISMCT
ncbi:hypothetical protein N7467_001570 [Penicillium canescens]|nr:hypothetical protein N7467_001570 [Penicillium canescens]